jgi:putative tryptophan/tyrosine transport system substrate-binding protein
MNRRAFLGTLALLAAPCATEGQPAVPVHRIGFLPAGASPAHRQQLDALREGLRGLGYVDGKTIIITAVWPKTTSELPEAAAALAKQDVKLIVAPATPAVAALKRVTSTIPIVFATAADPVGSGFVANLARPGGNITGLSQLNIELSGKRLELLREAFPARKAVMLLFQHDESLLTTDTTRNILRETERRGEALGIELRLLKVARVEELAAALGGLDARRDGGLILLPTPEALAYASTLADLTLKQKIPTIGAARNFADSGGLMAYAADLDDQLRRAATYVDRILKGARPGDLPVQQASRFHLVINLKTAQALGLTIPPSLLQRADQVIE